MKANVNKIAKNDFKTAQNVTQIALFLCIFTGIPWMKGYIRTRNVYCNWLAKSTLHEYISKWFLTGHPANTDTKLWYQGKACEHLWEWKYSIGSNIPCFFPGIGRKNPLLSADLHSTYQVDWMFQKWRELFSRIRLLWGNLTLSPTC